MNSKLGFELISKFQYMFITFKITLCARIDVDVKSCLEIDVMCLILITTKMFCEMLVTRCSYGRH